MSEYIETLRSKYDAHFGSEPSTVFPGHEYWDDSAGVPAIDVFVYRKEDTGRPHDVLITAGMSRQPMDFLPTYEGERWASELIWYFDEADRRDLQTTQWLAGLPFHDRFVLGFGHTVQFGMPIFEGGHLRHFLLLNTLVKIDARLFDDFHAAAHPVDLLWVVPLSEREYRFKREQGIDGLMPVFAENAHPVTVDKQRGCYLGGEGA
ncbi:suppressor of fused domain protein [Pseudomonas aeruginosa]|uniref:suppressor of fused domain protein n=1 Tax=Pseudomonas aeruginosa TaxID=287 RepID=UPI000F5379F5|nr:suppressor of fused domain protein [Pseudomonas aeruginosa]RQB77268.1 hypothetical protein IPC436_00740 [Pseudomonas aeruginosa]